MRMSSNTIEIPEEQLRAVMSALGRQKSEAKQKAARANIAKANKANRKNPLDLPCLCTGGESLDATAHKTTCPRGRLLWQRERAAEKAKAKSDQPKPTKTRQETPCHSF